MDIYKSTIYNHLNNEYVFYVLNTTDGMQVNAYREDLKSIDGFENTYNELIKLGKKKIN